MINKLTTTDKLYEESGEYILSLILDTFLKGKKVFLLVTGGSAIKSLQPLANWLNKYTERLDDYLVITLTDERYSEDLYSPLSNTTQINEKIKVLIDDNHEIGLIDLIENSGGYKGIFERVNHGQTKDEDIEIFDATMSRYISDDEYVKIAIFGIGEDSHISGMIPFPQNPILFDEKFNGIKLISGYVLNDNSNPYRDRITTTLTTLKKIDHSIIVISGVLKQIALQNSLKSNESQLYLTPATIIKQMKNVTIFSDMEINLNK